MVLVAGEDAGGLVVAEGIAVLVAAVLTGLEAG
jgi:hypothetical protein